jgi:hypothetical protein
MMNSGLSGANHGSPFSLSAAGHQTRLSPSSIRAYPLAQVRRSFATLWQTVASRPYQWATGNYGIAVYSRLLPDSDAVPANLWTGL